MPNCARKECPGIGHYIPILLIRARKKDTPLRADLPKLLVCEGHKLSSTVNDFLSDEGWDRIAKKLREAGRGSFSKPLTTLAWREIEKQDELPPDELAF